MDNTLELISGMDKIIAHIKKLDLDNKQLKEENKKLKADSEDEEQKLKEETWKVQSELIGMTNRHYFRGEDKKKLQEEIDELKAELEKHQDPTENEKRLLAQQQKGFMEEITKLKTVISTFNHKPPPCWCGSCPGDLSSAPEDWWSPAYKSFEDAIVGEYGDESYQAKQYGVGVFKKKN